MKNYICIDGNKTELTEEQLRELGFKTDTSVQEFVELLRYGDFRDEYGVGDTVELCGEDYTILGFDHDAPSSVTLMKSRLLPPRRMDNDMCEEGWAGTELRKWLNEEYINELPAELVKHMVLVKKVTYNYKGILYETTDKLFIPSESELFGSAMYSINEEGYRYELFGTSKNRQMKDEDGEYRWYWTRSARGGISAHFALVRANGNPSTHNASSGNGRVPLCFVIS